MTHYCKNCEVEHLISEFSITTNNKKKIDGTINPYPIYKCKKVILAKQKIYAGKNKDMISAYAKNITKKIRKKISKKRKKIGKNIILKIVLKSYRKIKNIMQKTI